MSKQGAIKKTGHRFKPGVSGNPKGRPKLGESLAEAVRAKWPPAKWVEHVSKLATKAVNEATRLSALQLIAERAYGRVQQGVDLDVVGVGPEAQAMLGAIVMTPHQRQQRIAQLKAEAAGASKPAEATTADADD